MVCTAEAAKCVVHLGRSYPREDPSCSGPVPTAKTTLNPAHVRPERRALHNEPQLDDTITAACASNRLLPLCGEAEGDHLSRLLGVTVSQSEIPVRWPVATAKMGREHPDRRAGAGVEQGGRLDGTIASRGGDGPVWRVTGLGRDIFDDDAGAAP